MSGLLSLIVKDTGWQYAPTARPSRGFHDYERIITLSREVTPEELEGIRQHFEKDKSTPYHYGGFFIGKMHSKTIDYRMTCECDSS